MGTTMVRYKVKQGQGDENQALVEAVFNALAEAEPAGLRYGTLRLEDGLTFVHIARIDDGVENPLASIDAFSAFTENIAERCDEPPQALQGDVIGNYRLYG